MISLQNLKPKNKKVARKRKGQGNATGNGTYGGRGGDGQNSRSGGGVRLGFEGGQSSFLQQMPKKPGFKNPNRVEFAEINLNTIEEHYKKGETVSLETLKAKELIHARAKKAKILGTGTLSKAVKVEGVAMTKSAAEMIEKTSGSATKEAKPKAEKKEA